MQAMSNDLRACGVNIGFLNTGWVHKGFVNIWSVFACYSLQTAERDQSDQMHHPLICCVQILPLRCSILKAIISRTWNAALDAARCPPPP